MEFMQKLTRLLSRLDFDIEAKHEALNYIPAHYRFISQVSEEAYTGDNDEDPIRKRKPHTRLMILIYKMAALLDAYEAKGFPDEVLLDTLSDVTLRQRMYLKQYGKLGLSDEDVMWLQHIYRLNIFKLGALQFEIAPMKYLTSKGLIYFDEFSKKLPEGAPVLNVHIRRGIDLSAEAVDQSFRRAERFFTKYYSEYDFVAYTCYSWLLYSGNQQLLPSSSRILAFAGRFDLIGESQANDMAIQYIYGKSYRAKKNYPRETSLQKNALKNMGNLGVGYGVIWKK
jgi:hypothetical protein